MPTETERPFLRLASEIRAGQSSRAEQLKFSSIEDGSLDEHDAAGTLMGSFGKQFDGTHGAVTFSGPPPPAPAAPSVTPGPLSLTVRSNGKFVDGIGGPAMSPLDYSHKEVHVSTDPTAAETYSVDTLRATLRGELGDEVVISPLPHVEHYVWLVTRSTAGKRSGPSEVTAGLPDEISSTAASGKITVEDRAPTLADGEGKPENAMWNQIDPATGEQVAVWRWDGAAWVDMPISETLLPKVNIAEGTYGKLTGVQLEANAIDGFVITGSVFQTDAHPQQGLKWDSAGIRAYGPGATPTFVVENGTGNVEMTGVVRSYAEPYAGRGVWATQGVHNTYTTSQPMLAAGIAWIKDPANTTGHWDSPAQVSSPDGNGVVILGGASDAAMPVRSSISVAPDYMQLVSREIGLSSSGQISISAFSNVSVTADAITLNGTRVSLEGHTHSWNALTSRPSTFPPSAHSHHWNDVHSKPTTFPPSGHTHDDRYTRNSGTGEVDTLWVKGERINAGWSIQTGVPGDSYLNSEAAYKRTYTSGANMYITGSHYIGRTTSSRRNKLVIEPFHGYEDKLLSLEMRTWIDRYDAEALAAHQTALANGGPVYREDGSLIHDPETLRRIPGMVAEEVEEAGLAEFVQYGEDGQVEGLMYDRLAIALIPIVARLRDRIAALEAHIKGEAA